MGARQVIDELGLSPKHFTQNQAERRYGKKNIAMWRSDKDIIPVKIGNRIYYDKLRLDQLSSINKLIERHGG
ncbi:hypothetical protein ACUNWD_10040 [Sunxiuqinia sp. A32]|uniref:hypothetical protein n=1 Tax=Sunxiuqinia sp. A32 TaxID=3461496 RepID=UPI004045EC84